MFKHLILLFISFVALTSAAFTLENNFFFLTPPDYGALSNQLFQTRHGIIAYSIDVTSNDQYVPNYVQIDLETKNVTQIIPDLPTACEQGPSIYDRFIYHALTYSFVYYCTSNNSILLLDPQNNFQVQQVFSLNISEIFGEVRMISDGYSVSIVGMSGLFSPNPNPSHLIKFNLQNQQVVTHVVFDHGLAAGEFVTAYDTNGNFFIITNIINSPINIANVYGMTLIGNSYSLTHIATFNSTSSYPYTIPEFYVNKNLIFASNGNNLVILDQNGNLQKVQGGVALNEFPKSLYRPAIVSYPGSGAVFVSLQNETLLKFSLVNQGFNVEDQGLATHVSLAIQDQLTDTLLFSFSGANSDFTITNLDSGKVIYESVDDFDDFMITDETYCVIHEDSVEIFALETNQLIQVIQFENEGYYDQQSSTFSFMSYDNNNNQYNLQQIYLTVGEIETLFSVSSSDLRLVDLVQATGSFDSPEFVIHMPTFSSNDEFLIQSKTFGQVKFSTSLSTYTSTLAVDYDTLDVFYFFMNPNNQTVSVTAYKYVSSNNSFVSTNFNQYPMDIQNDILIPAADYSVIQSQTGNVAVIEMSTLNQTDYSTPTQWVYNSYPNTFQNSSTGFKMVLSQGSVWGAQGETQTAGILYDNQIQQLPGTTGSTVQAGVAGSCSYWIVNQVGCFGVVEFYNICDNDVVSKIIA